MATDCENNELRRRLKEAEAALAAAKELAESEKVCREQAEGAYRHFKDEADELRAKLTAAVDWRDDLIKEQKNRLAALEAANHRADIVLKETLAENARLKAELGAHKKELIKQTLGYLTLPKDLEAKIDAKYPPEPAPARPDASHTRSEALLGALKAINEPKRKRGR